jgi:thiol-disulfide isomerase/thioredoxin
MSRPDLFADLSLHDAREAAKGKWLFIDFTAEWCGPCQHMDKTTWVDAKVVAWMKEHAVAVQIDVDQDPVAKEFGIKAMPTVVALRNDAEVDRIVGARSPSQLLEWVDGLERGKTDLDRTREGVGDDLMGRFQLAQTLLMRGAIDDSMEQLKWLWDNALRIEPAWIGVRHSFLMNLMAQAADASSKARATLNGMRDAAARGSRDWRILNQALRDNERTLAWFDEARAQGLPVKDEPDLRQLLRAHARWKDLGELITKPLELLKNVLDSIDELKQQQVPEEMRERLREHLRQDARSQAAHITRALKAAGRNDDALAVIAEAKRRDDSAEMASALAE